MKSKKTIISKIYLYICAFFAIYSVDLSYIIGINNFVLIFILFLPYFMIKFNILLKYIKKRPIFIFILLNILVTIYYAIRTIIAGTLISDISNLRIIQNLMPILYLIYALVIYDELDKLGYDKKSKIKFIINIALIQSCIAIMMAIIPHFKNVALNIFNNNRTEINQYVNKNRIFGICDGDYTYSLQILSSFLALLSLAFSYHYKEKKYMLYSIFILVVTILNGRTGIIIYVVGLAFLLLKILFNSKNIFKFLLYIILIGVSSLILYTLIGKYIPNSKLILDHGINDIVSFISDNNKQTELASLFDMIVFPDKEIYFIFGAGYRIFAKKGVPYGFYKKSDIGYINDIFMGGAIFIILLYGSYFLLIKEIKKRNKRKKNLFTNTYLNLLIISFLITNFKGEFFRSSTLLFFATLIITFFLLITERENENEKL